MVRVRGHFWSNESNDWLQLADTVVITNRGRNQHWLWSDSVSSAVVTGGSAPVVTMFKCQQIYPVLCLTKHHAVKMYCDGGIAPRILDLGTRRM